MKQPPRVGRIMGQHTETEWMAEAACAGNTDVDYFDLDCGLEAALELCAICPVGDKCLNYAIDHRLTDGIWGGEWGDSLLRLVRKKRKGGAGDG